MTKNIRHKCGEILGAFDIRGRILNHQLEPIKVENIAAVYEASFLCAKCGKFYIFNGRNAAKQQRKVLSNFEVSVVEAEKENK